MRRRDFLRLVAGVPSPGEGLVVPDGFTVREIAVSGEEVPGTGYVWHLFPDGGATFAAPDGGWVYVSNSEIEATGGAGAIRFDPTGEIVGAYRILDGTSQNCSGGATPWGTWLSCEEHDAGQVWECDPFGVQEAVARPDLGVFTHEAVAVDPVGRALYMTEDDDPGLLWRFTPAVWGDLGAGGSLEVAREAGDGTVTWVADPAAGTNYSGGEGIAYHRGRIAFTTKGDQRIRALDIDAQRVRVVSEGFVVGPDNVTFSAAGDLYVCEDTPTDQDLVVVDATGTASSFARLTGAAGSELAGVAFDPSGTRLYVSSQRGAGGDGVTYEISGPFPGAASAPVPDTSPPSTERAAPPSTLRPLSPAAEDGGLDAPVVGGVVAGVGVIVGGLVWLRRRRGPASS